MCHARPASESYAGGYADSNSYSEPDAEPESNALSDTDTDTDSNAHSDSDAESDTRTGRGGLGDFIAQRYEQWNYLYGLLDRWDDDGGSVELIHRGPTERGVAYESDAHYGYTGVSGDAYWDGRDLSEEPAEHGTDSDGGDGQIEHGRDE